MQLGVWLRGTINTLRDWGPERERSKYRAYGTSLIVARPSWIAHATCRLSSTLMSLSWFAFCLSWRMAEYGYSKNRYSVINLQLPRSFVGCMSVAPAEQILLLLPYLVRIRLLELHPIFRCELICASWLSDPSQHTHVMHTVYCVQRIRVEVY